MGSQDHQTRNHKAEVLREKFVQLNEKISTLDINGVEHGLANMPRVLGNVHTVEFSDTAH